MISPKRRKINLDLELNQTSRDCLTGDDSRLNLKKTTLYPVLSDDLTEDTALLEIYTDEITNPKDISKVVVDINSKMPLPELLHLKRIKGRNVLLFPTTCCESSRVHQYLIEKGFDTSVLANKIQIVSVAKTPPKVRHQYHKVNKLWPCNFHSNKYLERLVENTLFGHKEINEHEQHMRVATYVARTAGKMYQSKMIGAVVFEPKFSSIIAIGYDRVDENPCKHAVMMAIDNVAITQNGGNWAKRNKIIVNNLDTSGIPEELIEDLRRNFPKVTFGLRLFENSVEQRDNSYLCTGYYVYATHEPCIMCSMALVHSRISRVFFGAKTKKGGLTTLCKVQEIKDLNHHYEVFGGVLEHECVVLENA